MCLPVCACSTRVYVCVRGWVGGCGCAHMSPPHLPARFVLLDRSSGSSSSWCDTAPRFALRFDLAPADAGGQVRCHSGPTIPIRAPASHSDPRIPLRSSHPTQIPASHSDPRIPLRPPHPTQTPASHSDPRIPLRPPHPTLVSESHSGWSPARLTLPFAYRILLAGPGAVGSPAVGSGGQPQLLPRRTILTSRDQAAG